VLSFTSQPLEWVSEPVWTLWNTEISLVPTGNQTPAVRMVELYHHSIICLRGVVLIWISTGFCLLPLCTETIEKKNEQFGSKGQRRISKALYVQCKHQCFSRGCGEKQTFYETLPEHLLTNFRVSFYTHASTVPNYLR
jgi:hypothetical protein